MDKKIVKIEDLDINLSEITRIFPAVLVNLHGESALVSIEWAESKSDKIEIESYVLAIDVDPVGEPPINRKEFRFNTKDKLIEAMRRLID